MSDRSFDNSAQDDRLVKKLGYISILVSLLALWPLSLPLALLSHHRAVHLKKNRTISIVAIIIAGLSFIASLTILMIVYAYYQETSRTNHYDIPEPSITRDLD